MQIQINFTNVNASATGIRVYRSTTPIDPANLPAVYANIAGNATSYTDTSVVKDTTYYYMFEIYKGTDLSRSANIQATAAAYSGPGPQTFKGGDMSMGFYGTMSSIDFITYDAFYSYFPTLTVSGKPSVGSQDWLKFSHKGKVLITPKIPLGQVSWQNLYLQGLVYGTNDNGPRDYNTYTATNQLKTITVNGSTYKVRLPTALPPGTALTQSFNTLNSANSASVFSGYVTYESGDTTLDLTGSEWNDLFMKVFSWTSGSQRGRNWDRLDVAMTQNGNTTTYTGCISDWLAQEMASTGQVLTRGKFTNPQYQPGTVATIASNTGSFWWRPMLEML